LPEEQASQTDSPQEQPPGAEESPAPAASGDGPLSQADLDALVAGAEGGAEQDTAAGGIELPQLSPQAAGPGGGIEMLDDVRVNVRIELGRTHMRVEDIVRLSKGSLVELDKLAGDPVDVMVNNQLVARGEITIINDNFCVRILSIVTSKERLERT